MKRKVIFGAALLVLVCARAGQAQNVPMAITSDYYPQPKSLVLHLENNSGKDIVGYNITIRGKNLDGTPGEWSSTTAADALSRLVEIQTAKDPTAVARTDQKLGNGIFAADTTRDVFIQEAKDPSDVQAVADVVFYTDATFYEHNTDTFHLMLAHRQRRLLTIKTVNRAIENALADKDGRPLAAALTELTRLAVEQTVQYSVYEDPGQQYDPKNGQQFQLQLDIQGLQSYVQTHKDATERDSLKQYGEYLKKEIEVLTPHCHLEIALTTGH